MTDSSPGEQDLLPANPIRDTVSVLFSGGTDSTLAAALMLREAKKVELLTFDPGYVFFLENTKVHARALAEKFGEDRVEQKFLDLRRILKDILWEDVKGDFGRYGFGLTSLVCLGCRLSMHVAAIIHNLERGIPYLADGSIRVQSATPEQMESTLDSQRARYMEEYGLVHVSPMYEEPRSDLVLEDMDIAAFPDMKKQFILYDSQVTCTFGVSADVYARIFYQPWLMGDRRERDAAGYREQKYPRMDDLIRLYFEQKGDSLEDRIQNLRDTYSRDQLRMTPASSSSSPTLEASP